MDKKEQGRKNRKAGKTFEDKVFKQFTENNWIISRWMMNVHGGKICKAKPKIFRGRIINYFTGFPDFIAYYLIDPLQFPGAYAVIGVECKKGKYLTKKEKEKCEICLQHKLFSKIFIVSKGKKRGEIIYEEFKN